MKYFQTLQDVFLCSDIDEKFTRFSEFFTAFKNSETLFDEDFVLDELKSLSYTNFCEVKPMKDMHKVKFANKEVKFLHSIAHIEYSAIDLAIDHALRFKNLPKEYYFDWLEVGDEEIKHFKILNSLLKERGYKYGDLPVHDGLYIALQKTQHSIVDRMAVLPRYMEANGLDSNSFLMDKNLNSDIKSALEIILSDEISHVYKGDKWFKYFKNRQNDSRSYIEIIKSHYPNAFLQNREINVQARIQAGFDKAELEKIILIGKNSEI